MANRFAASNARIAAGCSRLFAPASRPLPKNRAPFEKPHVVLIVFFILSLILMWKYDYPLGLWMKEFPDEVRPAARLITDLGEGVEILVFTGVLVILGLFVPTTQMRRRIVVGANAVTAAASFIFLAVAGGGLLALLTKNIIGRARPKLLDTHGYVHFQPFTFDADFAAFPSGHSATAGAMAMSLALVFPHLRSLFIPVGVLICLTRQLVGAHWTSDTLMGWAVGVAFTLWLAHVFATRRLIFVYDSNGCLRRKGGRRVLKALWDVLRNKPTVAKIL